MFSNIALLVAASPLLLQAAYVPGTPGAPWSDQEVLDVKAKMRMVFNNPWGSMRKALEILGFPAERFNTDQASKGAYGGWRIPTPPKFLRLAFHDCVKYTDGTGGCDGCLNWHGMETFFDEQRFERVHDDIKFTNNNGLGPTVEMLEAIYISPNFPAGTPVLEQSLRDSGKSRADLWSLAAIVAVEWGIETNNRVCLGQDDTYNNGKGECHHLLGEDGCEVSLSKPIPFRTGRSDCEVTDPAFPYKAGKEEVHPNAVGSGYDTMDFFTSQFNMNGQEVVALLGAHTFGRFFIMNSLMPYVWVASGNRMFNNDYYKMIADKQRWFFDDGVCTKVGDAWGNKPERRWVTHIRQSTKNGGPVHWISQSYVCPNCVKGEQVWWNDKMKDCCTDVPEGNFCKPDELSLTEKTKAQQQSGCETWKFVMGVDEMALPAEMGLYFDFNQTDGFPTGCPGFERFSPFEEGKSATWSHEENGWASSDPGCNKQMLALPATDKPTSWYMDEYARDQTRWLLDFTNVLDKMMANGYTEGALVEGADQYTDVQCSPRKPTSYNIQCWRQSEPSGPEFTIESKLDGRVMQMNEETGEAELWDRIEGDLAQQWRWGDDILINSKTGGLLQIQGLVLFQKGEENDSGYSSLIFRGSKFNGGEEDLIVDRGWKQENGKRPGWYKFYNGPNQLFKFNNLNQEVEVKECEIQDETTFTIQNAKKNKVLTEDVTSGTVSLKSRQVGSSNQQWRWFKSCEEEGTFLQNVETGNFLANDVRYTNEEFQGNAWAFDEDNNTLKSHKGYAKNTKRRGINMDGRLRLTKKGTPWLWFQWILA